ncbi:MAG TPA: cupredoxin domain-containing protein, partial [Actinomycetota bacterium]|nr:cupredoxin domain-containing protein [Actinomycetota bacterium]
RQLLIRSAFGSATALAIVSALVFKTVVPPLAVVFVLLVAGGALALRTGGKGVAGVVLASLGGLMLCGLGANFVLGVIGAPEEPREFIPLVAAYGLSAVVVLSGAALAVRGRGRGFERSGAARAVGAVTVAALLAITAWSAFARMTFESAVAAAGDVRIDAGEFVFDPVNAQASAGKVAVHVSNNGVGLHTFTIDSLGVDMAIPAGKSQRVTFDAEAGNYTFYCKLHPGMDGRLDVS